MNGEFLMEIRPLDNDDVGQLLGYSRPANSNWQNTHTANNVSFTLSTSIVQIVQYML